METKTTSCVEFFAMAFHDHNRARLIKNGGKTPFMIFA